MNTPDRSSLTQQHELGTRPLRLNEAKCGA
jgi:hypothetical protein